MIANNDVRLLYHQNKVYIFFLAVQCRPITSFDRKFLISRSKKDLAIFSGRIVRYLLRSNFILKRLKFQPLREDQFSNVNHFFERINL